MPNDHDTTEIGIRFFPVGSQPPIRSASERGTLRSDYVPHPAAVEGLKRFGGVAANGATARVLFSTDEMHIAYAWFKSGFPLPLHSHDADCFYVIIAGSMHIGTQELRQGDGVLIPASTPYTVAPGSQGVEFLEIRPTQNYDTRYRGNTEAYWDRIIDTLQARKEAWETEAAPFGFLTRKD